VPNGRFFAERNGKIFLTGNCHPLLAEYAALARSVNPGHDFLAEPVAVAPRVWHLPRGMRWSWQGRTWLALGGAASPDRALRQRFGWGWFPQEVISAEDADRACRGPADVMVTHEAPAGAPVRYLDPPPAAWDQADLELGERQRDLMRQVVQSVGASQVFHGHHHQQYSADVQLESGLVRVTGLDMDGTGGNWAVLDTVTMALSFPGEYR
jgi:hypothetical protein